MNYDADELFANGIYWTSGTNKGYGCDMTYGWCSSSILMYANAKWTSREPIMHLQERCVVLDLSTNLTQLGFNDAPCDSVRPFICEVSVLPQCVFKKNVTKISLKGTVPECTPTCPDSCNRNVNKIFS